MDKSIEEKFVNNFVVKDKRERILHELNSKKKREIAMRRIIPLLDKRFVVFEGQNADDNVLLAELKKYTKIPKTCYNISDSSDDGNILPLEIAIKNMLEYEMSYVIICDENTVVASEEYEAPFGAPWRGILHKKD